MEKDNFPFLSKVGIVNESTFLHWFDSVIEAILAKNGNGNMAKAVDLLVNEILAKYPLFASVDKLIQRMYWHTNNHLLDNHFESFYRFYKELVRHRDKQTKNSILLEYAVCMFIEHDRKFERVSFFDEVLMPLIIQFKDDFISSLEENFFNRLFLGRIEHARTVVRYLVHIAKHLDRSDKKRIMAHINTVDTTQWFIRARGARRSLKQIFGSNVSGFDIYSLPFGILSEHEKEYFEQPCKMIGHHKNDVVLEISDKQYLFSMIEERKIFFLSSVKEKIKPGEGDAYFANEII